MSSQRVLAAAIVLVVGLLVAGCDSTATGTPVPQPDTSRTGPPSSERLSPPVENPKDLRDVDPCQLLTSQQAAGLSFTEPGTPGSGEISGDPGCTWSNSNLDINLQLNTDGGGLEQTYRGNFDKFEESTVGGYPTVRVNFTASYCGLFVGVAEGQVLSVSFGWITGDDPADGDSCGFAESVAAMVLENLPAG